MRSAVVALSLQKRPDAETHALCLDRANAAEELLCHKSSLAASHTSRFHCNTIRGREASNFLKYDFDGVGAAAAFRHAAERGVDVAHPRVGCGAANRGPYLTVAEDVTATYNHGVLLAKQAEESRYAPALRLRGRG